MSHRNLIDSGVIHLGKNSHCIVVKVPDTNVLNFHKVYEASAYTCSDVSRLDIVTKILYPK